MRGRRYEYDRYEDDEGVFDDIFEMLLVAVAWVVGAVLVIVLILMGVDHLLGTGFADQFLDWVKTKAATIGAD